MHSLRYSCMDAGSSSFLTLSHESETEAEKWHAISSLHALTPPYKEEDTMICPVVLF